MSEKIAAKYVADLVKGVEYIHSRQPSIIHRDLKPENLLINKSDVLKLADFGWS